MFLAKAAHVVISCFTVIRPLVPHLPFNPVELVEELDGLRRRPAGFLARLESIDKLPPGMGHAPDMRGAFQRAPGLITVTHQDAAVVAKEGLRMLLSAAGLIIEQHDRLFTVLAAAVSPHIRRAGRFLARFLQHLDCGLVAMNDGLRSKPQLQPVIETRQVFLARTDHPVAQSAAADRNPGALEGLRQTIERRAVHIFMNEREGADITMHLVGFVERQLTGVGGYHSGRRRLLRV